MIAARIALVAVGSKVWMYISVYLVLPSGRFGCFIHSYNDRHDRLFRHVSIVVGDTF